MINSAYREHERVVLKNGRSGPPRDFDKKAHHAAVTRGVEKSLTYGTEEADEKKKGMTRSHAFRLKTKSCLCRKAEHGFSFSYDFQAYFQ